jgi:hypothetical protein
MNDNPDKNYVLKSWVPRELTWRERYLYPIRPIRWFRNWRWQRRNGKL